MPVFTNPRSMPCFSKAPTLEDFEAIAAEALATIPEEFRRHVGNVRIQVDDFPSDEVEKAMELDTPFDLLGLYQGVSMMERGAGHVANDIDRIFLYRRPILDYWCEFGRGPAAHRAPRADPRDRPSLRHERRRHGSDRSQAPRKNPPRPARRLAPSSSSPVIRGRVGRGRASSAVGFPNRRHDLIIRRHLIGAFPFPASPVRRGRRSINFGLDQTLIASR